MLTFYYDLEKQLRYIDLFFIDLNIYLKDTVIYRKQRARMALHRSPEYILHMGTGPLTDAQCHISKL